MKKINTISKYFHHDEKKGQFTFIGDRLVLHIPKRYATYDLLSIGETVDAIGWFYMEIDEKYWTMFKCMASISMTYTDIGSVTKGKADYHVVTLRKGDIFIRNTTFVKSAANVNALYDEFITRGNMPPEMDYQYDLPTFLDDAGPICDAWIPVDHSIIELLTAHLSRDPNDMSRQVRYVEKWPYPVDYRFVALSNIVRSSTTTTSKIVGSYSSDGLASALVTKSESPSVVEDLLRGTYTPELDEDAF